MLHLQWTWISQVAYLPAIAMTKVAILQWFLTLFPNATFRKVVLGTIVHCILFMVSSFIATLLACVPMSYIWTNWTGMTKGYCYDNNAFWWAHSVRRPYPTPSGHILANFAAQAINIATDLWVLGLPMPILFKLQLGTRKKIYLVLMFSIGIMYVFPSHPIHPRHVPG